MKREQIIKVYAEHYHSPIGDLKGFNALLKEQFGFTTTKRTIAKVLGY